MSRSVRVLFPAPGLPVTPTTLARPFPRTRFKSSRPAGWPDSTKVKARAKALGSPSWKRRQSSSGMLMGLFYGFLPPCRKKCPYSARATQATSTRTPRGKAFTATVARAG